MRQRSFLFLVVLVMLFSGEISGQQKMAGFRYPVTVQDLIGKQFGENPGLKGRENAAGIQHQQPNRGFNSIRVRPVISVSGPVITPSYYCNNLGFFCKRELQLQKLTSLPVYIRLGGLQYVNYLEQKPNALKPGF